MFLEGTPGSGKSTLITQWSKQIPNKCIHYYAFDFTRPSAQLINDADRGDRISFLFDVIKMLEHVGLKCDDKTLVYKDYRFLKERFVKILNVIHQKYLETDLATVIVVNRLDHIIGEYTECLHTLIGALPSVAEVPDGVIFLLGSQYFKGLNINRTILAEYDKNVNTVIMSPLSDEEINNLTTKFIGLEIATVEVVNTCVTKSQGHSLYLRYLLNQVTHTKNPDILNDISAYDGDIGAYYNNIVPCLNKNAGMQRFLALLSRVIGEINYEFVKEWDVDSQVFLDFKNTLCHLFIKNRATRTLAFFHNSFRQFLLNETAKDSFDDTYSEEQNRVYYKILADYTTKSSIVNNWNVPSYLFMAQEYNAFLAEVTSETIFKQLQDFRPLWYVRRDTEKIVSIAVQKKNVCLMVRILLLQSQFSQMGMQDYSALSMIEQFIEMDRDYIEKLHIREDRELKCSQSYALELARLFYGKGDLAEANVLSELSYPEFLSHKPDEFHNRYNALREYHQLLEDWVHTAPYFLPLDKVETEIEKFVIYLQTLAENDSEEYDAAYSTYLFRREIVASLVEQLKWGDLETYVSSIISPYSLLLCYYAYREKVSMLLMCNAETLLTLKMLLYVCNVLLSR